MLCLLPAPDWEAGRGGVPEVSGAKGRRQTYTPALQEVGGGKRDLEEEAGRARGGIPHRQDKGERKDDGGLCKDGDPQEGGRPDDTSATQS